MIGKVDAFTVLGGNLINICSHCGAAEVAAASDDIACLGKNKVPRGWLKRIPPIEELDDVRQDEEITA